VVLACRSDRLEADLRHEVTHALLHASGRRIPLWLDEGLAEYFETSAWAGSVNPAHVAALSVSVGQGWRPDLDRLSRLKDLWQVRPDDYRESWLWVHYLMHSSEEARQSLIDGLSTGSPAQESWAERVGGVVDRPVDAVVAHLESLRRGVKVSSAVR
jgi:hypothetical protein